MSDITPLTNLSTKEEFKNQLKEWLPSSKKDSVRMLHLLSVISSESDRIKKACYEYLLTTYPDALNAVDATSGLELIKVTPKEKVYKESKKTKELHKKIEVLILKLNTLKAELKKEYEINGVEYTVEKDSYFKVSK